MKLIAFSRSRNCVNTQYAALSGAMNIPVKDTSFIFQMTKVTIFSIFPTHAQMECHKVLEIKSAPLLNILALLHFEG